MRSTALLCFIPAMHPGTNSCTFPAPLQSATWEAMLCNVNSTGLEQDQCCSYYVCDSGGRRISLYSRCHFPGGRVGCRQFRSRAPEVSLASLIHFLQPAIPTAWAAIMTRPPPATRRSVCRLLSNVIPAASLGHLSTLLRL